MPEETQNQNTVGSEQQAQSAGQQNAQGQGSQAQNPQAQNQQAQNQTPGAQSQTARSQSAQSQGIQRGSAQGAGGLSRRGMGGVPGIFSMNPFSMLAMSPFALMRQFTEEMDRMFDDFGVQPQASGGVGSQSAMQQTGGAGLQRGGFGQSLFTPQVEVFERENHLIVRADLPGMDKDDVRIEITDDGLLIEGERRFEHTENQGGIYRSERSYGTFRRHVPLPEGVNPEAANARFQNGVLEITMQAPQPRATSRRIEIQGDSNTAASTSSQEQTQQSTQQASGEQAQAAGAGQ